MKAATAPKAWQDRVALAEHYLAVGQVEHYLSKYDDGDDRPWEYATYCKSGGSHRLEIDTNVWFYAEHPSGLMFRWSFDIEPTEANGSSRYQIDVAGCQAVLAKLPERAKASFNAYLMDCADKVEVKAREWQGFADHQYLTATSLRRACHALEVA